MSTAEPRQYAALNLKPSMKKSFRPEAVKFWLNTVPKQIGVNILQKSRLPAAKLYNHHTEL